MDVYEINELFIIFSNFFIRRVKPKHIDIGVIIMTIDIKTKRK